MGGHIGNCGHPFVEVCFAVSIGVGVVVAKLCRYCWQGNALVPTVSSLGDDVKVIGGCVLVRMSMLVTYGCASRGRYSRCSAVLVRGLRSLEESWRNTNGP